MAQRRFDKRECATGGGSGPNRTQPNLTQHPTLLAVWADTPDTARAVRARRELAAALGLSDYLSNAHSAAVVDFAATLLEWVQRRAVLLLAAAAMAHVVARSRTAQLRDARSSLGGGCQALCPLHHTTR